MVRGEGPRGPGERSVAEERCCRDGPRSRSYEADPALELLIARPDRPIEARVLVIDSVRDDGPYVPDSEHVVEAVSGQFRRISISVLANTGSGPGGDGIMPQQDLPDAGGVDGQPHRPSFHTVMRHESG